MNTPPRRFLTALAWLAAVSALVAAGACGAGCCLAAEPAAKAAPPSTSHGLTVRDGRLSRYGKAYRGIGVNYCDLFQDMIHHPKQGRTLAGLRFLGTKSVPFVRFWCGGFWPSDWDLYFADKAEWFRRLDQVVRTAEQAGVGLVPSLFWRTATYPDLFDEYQDAWADPHSKTRAFMVGYVREVVTRYRNSPALWGWEFANEMNLACDLPNGMQFLGKKIPRLKVNLARHKRNLMTYKIAAQAYAAFAAEVRKHDSYRFVTTGNAAPRAGAWHNATEKNWVGDTPAQAFEAFRWTNPASMNVASVHFYPVYGKKPVYADATGIGPVLACWKSYARRLGQPLLVGEFSASAHDKGLELAQAQFRAHQTAILNAIVASGADLAAYWVFDYTAGRKGPGLVRRDNEYAWVLDQLAEYNRKLSGGRPPSQ